MWRFKPFMPKEQIGLEGRVIDISNFKVQVRNVIAEGGFSCVYLARDAIHGSKQYALKQIICNDEESQELVMKEIAVLKSLKGHPNVVTLYADAIFNMGRTMEAFLLMEYCEKSLVNVLESRGAGFFEEKQILTIFRDVCNAVFAMHCQSPPIAHRDLKAENLLLGSDRLWKLCDFGSTSTKHKRFEKPEEMGIEEDNIRKYTTPAYRAPEMWDLFRRELINEKVDIWALGCLLFRICYFKLAFDGESKLQILNGNYRIPELPKYSISLTDLIREMLQSSPDDRPDIMQVSFRVNDLLPDVSQKSLPDRPTEILQQSTDVPAGMPKLESKSNTMPHRSPPPPPSTESPQNASSVSNNPKPVESTALFGAFWATLQANDSDGQEDKTKSECEEDIINRRSYGHEKIHPAHMTQLKEQNLHSQNAQSRSVDGLDNVPAKDLKTNLFQDDLNHNSERFQSDTYNSFVADFSTSKQSPSSNCRKSGNELAAEVQKLKEHLSRVCKEKAEVTFKYEKLSAICRSQGQEIQDLKQAVAARGPTDEKIEGTELQKGLFDRSSPCPDPQQWKAFSDDAKPHTTPTKNDPTFVQTRIIQHSNQAAGLTSGANVLGFESDNFKAVPSANSKRNVVGGSKNSQCFGESKSMESKFDPQPAGWAGF